MKAYKTFSVISDSKQVILSNVPFSVGDKVEVVVSKPEKGSRADRIQKLEALFKKTQSMPQARSLTEDEIISEVDAHRSGQ